MSAYTSVLYIAAGLTLLFHFSAMILVWLAGPTPTLHHAAVINKLLTTAQMGYMGLVGVLGTVSAPS